IVLVGYTIPRFLQVYERLNAQIELPLPTRIVMDVSAFMRTYWPVLLSSTIAAAVSLRLWGQTASGAITLSRITLRIPIVGELCRKIALSRFSRYFASLHSAGLEMAPTLSLISRLIGNAYLTQRFEMAVERVMAGESLSRAL